MEMQKEFYFSYSTRMTAFLVMEGHKYIFEGLSMKGNRVTIFEMTSELKKSLEEYTKLKELNLHGSKKELDNEQEGKKETD